MSVKKPEISDEEFQQYVDAGLIQCTGWRPENNKVVDCKNLMDAKPEDIKDLSGIEAIWRISEKASDVLAEAMTDYLLSKAITAQEKSGIGIVVSNGGRMKDVDRQGSPVHEAHIFMCGDQAEEFKTKHPELPPFKKGRSR